MDLAFQWQVHKLRSVVYLDGCALRGRSPKCRIKCYYIVGEGLVLPRPAQRPGRDLTYFSSCYPRAITAGVAWNVIAIRLWM